MTDSQFPNLATNRPDAYWGKLGVSSRLVRLFAFVLKAPDRAPASRDNIGTGRGGDWLEPASYAPAGVASFVKQFAAVITSALAAVGPLFNGPNRQTARVA